VNVRLIYTRRAVRDIEGFIRKSRIASGERFCDTKRILSAVGKIIAILAGLSKASWA
jgi:hypothetical protein